MANIYVNAALAYDATLNPTGTRYPSNVSRAWTTNPTTGDIMFVAATDTGAARNIAGQFGWMATSGSGTTAGPATWLTAATTGSTTSVITRSTQSFSYTTAGAAPQVGQYIQGSTTESLFPSSTKVISVTGTGPYTVTVDHGALVTSTETISFYTVSPGTTTVTSGGVTWTAITIGDTWSNAFPSMHSAAKATAAPYNSSGVATTSDIVYVSNTSIDYQHQTTGRGFAFANRTSVISTNDTTNMPPTSVAPGAIIRANGAIGNVNTQFGPYSQMLTSSSNEVFYAYGISLEGSTSSSGPSIVFYSAYTGTTNNCSSVFEKCEFILRNSSQAAQIISYTANNSEVITKNCKFKLSAANQRIYCSRHISENDIFGSYTGATFSGGIILRGTKFYCINGDFTLWSGGTLANPNSITTSSDFTFINCALPSTMTKLNSANLNPMSELNLYNCSYGDVHYGFYHENFYGSTESSIEYTLSDGAAYNGSNRIGWKVIAKSTASYNRPYISPWIDVYYDPTAGSKTPWLECLRFGSSTPYTNKELWSEWSHQSNSGICAGVLSSDMGARNTTASNQESSTKINTDWKDSSNTSITGSNWFGKLGLDSSISPVEIGYLRGRVLMATAGTVYIDPIIRMV